VLTGSNNDSDVGTGRPPVHSTLNPVGRPLLNFRLTSPTSRAHNRFSLLDYAAINWLRSPSPAASPTQSAEFRQVNDICFWGVGLRLASRHRYRRHELYWSRDFFTGESYQCLVVSSLQARRISDSTNQLIQLLGDSSSVVAVVHLDKGQSVREKK
jgi:hypothetical protein